MERTTVIENLVEVTGDESWRNTVAETWELQLMLAMVSRERERDPEMVLV